MNKTHLYFSLANCVHCSVNCCTLDDCIYYGCTVHGCRLVRYKAPCSKVHFSSFYAPGRISTSQGKQYSTNTDYMRRQNGTVRQMNHRQSSGEMYAILIYLMYEMYAILIYIMYEMYAILIYIMYEK